MPKNFSDSRACFAATLPSILCRAIFLALAIACGTASAQQGDQSDPGTKQTPRVPADKIPPAPPLSPSEALASFKLQPGFRIELVASEPLIHDPIAIRFDTRGRIWVLEMSGYMPNPDGRGEDQPIGKVAVLEDTDHDGKPDRRTEFLTGLVMPGAISLVADGVLVGAPPHLWYCRDTNGDLKCDVKTEIAGDFGVVGNPQHTPNGLVWALDNWIYTASWPFRLKLMADGQWIREATVPRGQHGLSQDDYGRLVYNSNEDPFRIDLISSHYLQRNPNYRTSSGLNVDPIDERTVWPARVNPAVNRGYREGILRENGTLFHFTAACSPLIYRGGQFPPEFYGNAFVCEPAGNLIKRYIISDKDGVLHGRQAYTNAEFLASTDERFRPVSLANGPDGALYAVDFYHGLLEHKISLTSYLRHQTESRHLDSPIGMGRIYRISRQGNPPDTAPNWSALTPQEIALLFNTGNGWTRDTAQRLLVEGRATVAISTLRQLATTATNPIARLDSLWTLEGLGALDADLVLRNLNSPDPKVRLGALRLSEAFLRGEDAAQFTERFSAMSANETAPDVLLQLALTLGQTTGPEAEASLIRLSKAAGSKEEMADAILTGLGGRELAFLKTSIQTPAAPRRLLNGLATCIFRSRNPTDIQQLFAMASTAGGPERNAMLQGMANAAPGILRSASRGRIRFTEEPEGWQKLSSAADSGNDAKWLATVANAITWPGQPGYVPATVTPPLNALQKTHFELGMKLYTATCAGCHQTGGQGLSGVAPPLVDSEWVLGSERRLASLVLLGVHGHINASGQNFDLEMPAMGSLFGDEQIASILTYIRREWDNAAPPVETDTVTAIRSTIGIRTDSWTAEELNAIK